MYKDTVQYLRGMIDVMELSFSKARASFQLDSFKGEVDHIDLTHFDYLFMHL